MIHMLFFDSQQSRKPAESIVKGLSHSLTVSIPMDNGDVGGDHQGDGLGALQSRKQ